MDDFTSEASAPKPDREWYSVSAEGLLDAAEAVGSIGKPVTTVVQSVLKLLP